MIDCFLVYLSEFAFFIFIQYFSCFLPMSDIAEVEIHRKVKPQIVTFCSLFLKTHPLAVFMPVFPFKTFNGAFFNSFAFRRSRRVNGKRIVASANDDQSIIETFGIVFSDQASRLRHFKFNHKIIAINSNRKKSYSRRSEAQKNSKPEFRFKQRETIETMQEWNEEKKKHFSLKSRRVFFCEINSIEIHIWQRERTRKNSQFIFCIELNLICLGSASVCVRASIRAFFNERMKTIVRYCTHFIPRLSATER